MDSGLSAGDLACGWTKPSECDWQLCDLVYWGQALEVGSGHILDAWTDCVKPVLMVGYLARLWYREKEKVPIKHSKELRSGAEYQLLWASRRDTGNTILKLNWVPRYFWDWLVHSTFLEAWTLQEQWRRHLILRKFITNWAIWEAECSLLLWKDLRRQNRRIILMPH